MQWAAMTHFAKTNHKTYWSHHYRKRLANFSQTANERLTSVVAKCVLGLLALGRALEEVSGARISGGGGVGFEELHGGPNSKVEEGGRVEWGWRDWGDVRSNS